MTMKLDSVVPFGRSLDEYTKMFSLSADDLAGKIIGVADGPASFCAEMTAVGRTVVSVDPLYAFSAGEIERRFHAVVDNIIAQVAASPENWVWSYHGSPDVLRTHRVNVLKRFMADFEEGRRAGRYVAAELPHLPFADRAFRLALCSHFLFLYSDQLTYGFHLESVREMLRVATEVRIFPLLTLKLDRFPYMQRLCDDLGREGCAASVERVAYEFQKGGNEMLRITKTG